PCCDIRKPAAGAASARGGSRRRVSADTCRRTDHPTRRTAMSTQPRLGRLAFALIAMSALAGSAAAQVQVTKPAQRATPLVRPGVVVAPPAARQPLSRHRADVRGLRDNGQAALDNSLPAGWALSGFHLAF